MCAGGIIGLGEGPKDRVGLIHQLATLPEHPESVPINALVAVSGGLRWPDLPCLAVGGVRCPSASSLPELAWWAGHRTIPRHLRYCQVSQHIHQLVAMSEHLVINTCEAVASGGYHPPRAPGQTACLTFWSVRSPLLG